MFVRDFGLCAVDGWLQRLLGSRLRMLPRWKLSPRPTQNPPRDVCQRSPPTRLNVLQTKPDTQRCGSWATNQQSPCHKEIVLFSVDSHGKQDPRRRRNLEAPKTQIAQSRQPVRLLRLGLFRASFLEHLRPFSTTARGSCCRLKHTEPCKLSQLYCDDSTYIHTYITAERAMPRATVVVSMQAKRYNDNVTLPMPAKQHGGGECRTGGHVRELCARPQDRALHLLVRRRLLDCCW